MEAQLEDIHVREPVVKLREITRRSETEWGSENVWSDGCSLGEDFVDGVSDFSSNTPSACNFTPHVSLLGGAPLPQMRIKHFSLSLTPHVMTPASYVFPKKAVSPTTHFVTPSTFLFPKDTVFPEWQHFAQYPLRSECSRSWGQFDA